MKVYREKLFIIHGNPEMFMKCHFYQHACSSITCDTQKTVWITATKTRLRLAICKPNGSLITSISNSSLPVVVLAMILPASLPDVCGSPQNWSQFFLCMLLLLHTTIVVVVGQIMTGRRLLESPVPSFSVILSLAGAQCSAPPTS